MFILYVMVGYLYFQRLCIRYIAMLCIFYPLPSPYPFKSNVVFSQEMVLEALPSMKHCIKRNSRVLILLRPWWNC